MNEQNLSQWFDLAQQNPWEVGVYELSGDASWNCYAYWDGKSFSYAWTSEIVGSRQLAYESRNQKNQVHWFSRMKKWRGLSTKTEVKKKPQNKRKTVYRVYSMSIFDFQYILIACFDSRKEAEAFIDHRQSLDSGMRFNIKPLRFRTPE